jgi:hypothetical protein
MINVNACADQLNISCTASNKRRTAGSAHSLSIAQRRQRCDEATDQVGDHDGRPAAGASKCSVQQAHAEHRFKFKNLCSAAMPYDARLAYQALHTVQGMTAGTEVAPVEAACM